MTTPTLEGLLNSNNPQTVVSGSNLNALANNAGPRATLVVGGPGRIKRRRCTLALPGVRPPPRILPLQAGIAPGQVSPDYSRVLRE